MCTLSTETILRILQTKQDCRLHLKLLLRAPVYTFYFSIYFSTITAPLRSRFVLARTDGNVVSATSHAFVITSSICRDSATRMLPYICGKAEGAHRRSGVQIHSPACLIRPVKLHSPSPAHQSPSPRDSKEQTEKQRDSGKVWHAARSLGLR